MAKVKTVYACQECGHTSLKWLGRCPDCSQWNTIVEEKRVEGRKKGFPALDSLVHPAPITAVGGASEERTDIGIGELDRVLGGGMVPGACVLVGGDPGIGKSTLLLQAMGVFAKKGHRVLYVSGEESMRQIRLRAERLAAVDNNLFVWCEVSVEKIVEMVREMKPEVLVVDSVQTMYTDEIESSPGSVSQLREASLKLITLSKAMEIPLFLIGHVTKEGAIAGPKVLEHMVDTVLYFEGKTSYVYRILRAVKNRFGSVMEIGVFEMKDSGLCEVVNPSEVFLQEMPEGTSGSAVAASLEGTRTLLIEIQALVSKTFFGMPRRTVVGVDYNKVLLLVAVLERKAGIALSNHDIFVKVAGGMRTDEPAVDMAILASIVSNYLEKPVGGRTVVFGEVGLAGEVRAVNHAEQRIKEAKKLGFARCILPKDNLKGMNPAGGIEAVGVATVKEAIDALFG
ncbi:MAG: DNA repair protein RadA, partial [Deltaproteobacteria bacterium]|nr:DNA repair protein RadA [Deltaproteobacteria bacterium]